MALPLIPLAIKGLMLLAKAGAAKGAVAKTAVVTVKTFGVANTIVGLAVIGGIAWSMESIAKARRAYAYSIEGNLAAAAGELAALATSIHSASTDTLSTDLTDWISDGHPLDARVFDLAKRCWDAAEEADKSTS